MTAERWTTDEDALLRANKPVPNRTAQACWTRAHRLGVPYTPKNPKCGMRIDEKTKDLIAEEVRKTRNTRATGRKFGVSYEAVRAVCAERHIAVQPSSRDLLGDYVEWGGAKWVWTEKGYWRETGGERRNLARTLWEHYHCESLPNGFCVFFRDGNRHNLKRDNLEAMTMSEFTRRRLTIDPLFRATMLAAGAIGRLVRKAKEDANPYLGKERGKRCWESRKRNGNDHNKRTWTEEEIECIKSGDYTIPLHNHTQKACYRMKYLLKKNGELEI